MKIVFLTSEFDHTLRHLQPARFIHQLARGLSALGHEVSIVSGSHTGYNTMRLKDRGGEDVNAYSSQVESFKDLCKEMAKEDPDVLIVSLGPLSSLFGDSLSCPARFRVAIITFPVYTLRELASALPRISPAGWIHAYQHYSGRALMRHFSKTVGDKANLIVVMSAVTADRLASAGIDKSKILTVMPGIDEQCGQKSALVSGKNPSYARIAYMGSSLPLRGAFDLVSAYKLVVKDTADAQLRLLIRPDPGCERYTRRLGTLVGSTPGITMCSSMLSQCELTAEIRASTVVVFPFRLIPSEMPVGPLEAIDCGAKVIVPRLSSLTELERFGAYTYEPNNTRSLANTITRVITEPRKPEEAILSQVNHWSYVSRSFETELLKRSGLK